MMIEVRATANAAGLKMCFLLMAKMYFDAIAQTDAHIKNEKPDISLKDDSGVIINTKIKAVMYIDSTFAGALNTRAKILLVIQQVRIITRAEIAKASGPYGNTPKEPKMTAAKKRNIR